ncbi:MAG: hypothetical protein RIS52_1465 [Pseudomonadota bacterium]
MIALDRRSMLEGIGGLIGLAALPADAFAAMLGKKTVVNKKAGHAPLLDKRTTALVTALADTLIPRTDTPGAVQVGVPAKFDALLRDWANASHRAAHIAALAAIDSAAMGKLGKPFALLSVAARTTFLKAYDAEHFASNADYAKLKDLLVSLYYFSEPGATVELRYEHSPGAWEASIPLTPATRAWAGANGS